MIFKKSKNVLFITKDFKRQMFLNFEYLVKI